MNSSITIALICVTLLLVTVVAILLFQFRRSRRLNRILEQKKLEVSQVQLELTALQEQVQQLDDREEGDEAPEPMNEGTELILKKALKRAKEETFQKNTFLSNLSSEIRTPLNNIIGFASLLETEASLLENKELFEYARGISESGDRLISLLNNIIDISRIESNDVDIVLGPCSVSSIISSVGQLYVFKANDQRIKFNIINKDIPDAMADDKILSKVLGGVVDNAIKYTKKGFVNISTGYDPKTNEITIRVKDSGSGIDPTYLKEIFNAFRPDGPGYTKETQGTRLGLPIAKRFMEMMDGDIGIESTKGEGTTVTIFLRAAKEKEEIVIEEVVGTGDESDLTPRKTRILKDLDIFIVEDDLMNSMVLVQMTKSLGKVTTAVNGEATLKIIHDKLSRGETFDIMLFDINLPPPWDGVKLMQTIRKKYTEYSKIPFIAQTAYAMAGDREKLLEAGFDDYIAKPINKNELYTIMKNQLEIH